ncbi:hypothetical protein DFS34DRAFT_623205 [Phlyctochytrium arcticum]|nr:hypothetical protein DFS34DRAFT_623205 [Phlyctochytrium arcticum]
MPCSVVTVVDRGKPWCNKKTLIPVSLSPPLYVVLNKHLGTTRFLVYDEIEDSFAWIGDDPSDAADAWNFADLGRWIAISDSTGDKESYAVKDPSISEAVGQALECLGIQSKAGDGNKEKAWAEVQRACTFIADLAYSTLVGPQVPRILSIINAATLDEAHQWYYTGDEYRETLELSRLDCGSVHDVAKQICYRYKHSLPELHAADQTQQPNIA